MMGCLGDRWVSGSGGCCAAFLVAHQHFVPFSVNCFMFVFRLLDRVCRSVTAGFVGCRQLAAQQAAQLAMNKPDCNTIL